MDPITLLILAVLGLASAGASAGVSAWSSAKNMELQRETNALNIDMQKEINAQNQYNIEHAHQIEMNDLAAAGLNPVLTATGGSGAPIQALQSPKAVAPQMDLSGVASAIGGIGHMATSAMMMKVLSDNTDARNQTLSAIANSRNAQSAANAALRANTSQNIQKMKNQFSQYNLTHQAVKGRSYANSSKFMDDVAKKFGMSSEAFNKMIHTNLYK